MKRIALCLAVVAVLAACPKSSEASDLTRILRIAFGAEHHPHRYPAPCPHVGHHGNLPHHVIQPQVVQPVAYQQAYLPPAYAARVAVPRAAVAPQYIQSYPAVPAGYGVQYGAAKYQPSLYDKRVDCSPYGR